MKEPILFVEHEGVKYVVDGHHRLAVAKGLGWATVPAKQVTLPHGSYRTPDDLNVGF
jgi:ParB-like chromosome segregation protein Spo0J